MTMRLLPNDKDIGWIPYAWLIYLSIPLFYPLAIRASRAQWIVTLLSVAVFLVLYFRGYWLKNKPLVWIVAAITLLAIVVCPFNAGGSVYFIYAASFIAKTGEPRFALRLLLLVTAAAGLTAWLVRLPPESWIPAVIFSLLIGAVNLHYTQRRRDNEKLLRAQEEVEHMAKVAERERIARDLHDVLGHTLSVIVLKSELASKLADIDPARAVREIRDVEHISRDALAQVRSTVRGYQAHSFQAEAQQAAAALEAAGVQVQWDFRPTNLPPTHEGVLALALREAVTNIIRHASATTCKLNLRPVEGGCELEIKDDGCGRLSPEGIGLSGMRQRVEALGGKLRREAASGTRLVITLPVSQ